MERAIERIEKELYEVLAIRESIESRIVDNIRKGVKNHEKDLNATLALSSSINTLERILKDLKHISTN